MLPNYPAEEGVVKRMREIRDEQSAITMNMTFEEVKAYYRERILKEDPDFYKKVEEDKQRYYPNQDLLKDKTTAELTAGLEEVQND